MTAPNGTDEVLISEQVRFLHQARLFGWARLLKSRGLYTAGLLALPFVVLVAVDQVRSAEVVTIVVAFLGLAAALFGIVLAGLAIVGVFFDRDYAVIAYRSKLLEKSLFLFWWVGTLAVIAICTASLTLLLALVSHCAALLAPAVGVSAFFFFATLLESLSLLGHLMRQGMYRAAVQDVGLKPSDLDAGD
jgi:hypothetical protein